MGWRNFEVCSDNDKIVMAIGPMMNEQSRYPTLMPLTSQTPSVSVSQALDTRATLSAAVDMAEAVTLTFETENGRICRRVTLEAVTDAGVAFTVNRRDELLLRDVASKTADFRVIVALRVQGNEIVFFAPVPSPASVEQDNSASPTNVNGVASKLILPLPDQIVVTKRRQNFRIAVAQEDQIQLRVWRIDDYAILRDTPPPSKSFPAVLYDLSASGLRAMLTARPVAAMQLCFDQRFRIEITTGDVQMLFDARLRHPRMSGRDDAFAFCGFEFVKRQDNIEGRRNEQRLATLIAKLQRLAAQRQSSAA